MIEKSEQTSLSNDYILLPVSGPPLLLICEVTWHTAAFNYLLTHTLHRYVAKSWTNV